MIDGIRTADLDLVGLRRLFHAHAETAFTELWTSAAIAAELRRLGWRVRTGPEAADLSHVPAEEGGRGARAMLAAGACDGVDRLYALHLGLGLPVGWSAAPAPCWTRRAPRTRWACGSSGSARPRPPGATPVRCARSPRPPVPFRR
ncbi:hypothetical protein ACQP1W_16515 [Spirillospora sp. CA-255316]